MSDRISREWLIKQLESEKEYRSNRGEIGAEKGLCYALEIVDDMPSAQKRLPDDDKDTNVPINDCINRQAAIDAVEFGITYAKAINKSTGEVKELFKEGNKALNEAVERLKELPSSQPEQQWIPCSERLPGREWVLCKCRANIHEVLSLRDGYWYHDPQHHYMSGFVTHWMPLPEPPKEDER